MRARGLLTGDGKTAALEGKSNSLLHRQHGVGVIKCSHDDKLQTKKLVRNVQGRKGSLLDRFGV